MKYKNISDKDLSMPGIGIVKSGESREMPQGFHNANFVLVEKEQSEEKGKVDIKINK
jgi:hypothetical protein